jgi:hypothetical protein
MPEQPAALYTVGQIADKLDIPIHMVRYIIESRRIAPVCRLGHVRVFGAAAIEAVRSAGEKINRDRERARARRAS